MKIRIDELEKIYHTKSKEVVALNKVSLELPTVGFVCICGKNGSGKSTFLNCISLLDEDFQGKIYLDDTSVSDLSEEEKRIIRCNTFGYIFQKNNLINSLSVKENIHISSTIFKEQLNEISIEDDSVPMTNYPNQLSGGQQQKTAIYRALVQNKPVIICDEPTASLDYENTKKVIEMLKDISQKRLVICVTHDQELIEEYADRIIEFESGKIVRDDVVHYTVEKTEIPKVANVSKNIHYSNLLKMSFCFIKKKAFLTICFSIIMAFLFLAISLVSSYVTFDSKGALIEHMESDKIYTPNQSIESKYINGKQVCRDIQISESIINNCISYLGEDQIAYSVSDVYDGVLFFKNSQIPVGEGMVGTKTLKNIFKKDRLDEAITIEVYNHLQCIQIKLTSTFEGEGIRCDYETAYQYTNHSILVYGGLWKNSLTDTETMSMDYYLDMGIEYVPVSYYNSQLTEGQIVLSDNEAIISENLVKYIDYDSNQKSYIKNFIRFEDFTNQDFLYTYVNMNEIFDNGMKIIASTKDQSVINRINFVIISDSKYKMIEESSTIFTGVSFYGKNNEEKIVDLFLNCNYTFSKDQASNETIDQILRLGQDIQKTRTITIVIIFVMTVILMLVTYILMNTILKNDYFKIGIFRCLGLSKKQSLFSSCSTLLFIELFSIFISFILNLFVMKRMNELFKGKIHVPNISIFRIDYKVVCIIFSLLILVCIISIFYLFITNRKKQIKDYFLID